MNFRSFLLRVILRVYLRTHLSLVWLFGRLIRKKAPRQESVTVQLTGTFYSDNWVLAHIRPLARAANCRKVVIVTTNDVSAFENVEIVNPRAWQIKLFGNVVARLLTHFGLALKSQPDFVGGFHLLFNGLASGLIASLCGARSLYFCVGGPAEVLDGGLLSENRLFEKIGSPDPTIEKLLIRSVGRFDQIVTMGTSARKYFLDQNVSASIDVISGGIDLTGLPEQPIEPCQYDLIFVGRLVPIKGLNLLLEAIVQANSMRPGIKLAIVGDGPLRSDLEKTVIDLGLESCVDFIGFSENVDQWLAKASIFVLASESEGLSLALMEAMAHGLAAIVPNVGDLDNLVRTGNNGIVLEQRSVDETAGAIVRMLDDPETLHRMRMQAMKDARVHSIENCAGQWQHVLNNN